MEHARDTLTDLLGLLIDHTKTPLVLSKLEGDAVFSYTWGEEAFKDGQTLVELIEATYVAFRRAIDLMVMNNTCQCAACANVSKLDLKFFVHHGTFAQQELGGQSRTRWHGGDSGPPLDEEQRERGDRDYGLCAVYGCGDTSGSVSKTSRRT